MGLAKVALQARLGQSSAMSAFVFLDKLGLRLLIFGVILYVSRDVLP